MSAKYLIRLDDACPTFSLAKWQRFFNLFDKYGIKPIIAVIPDCKDKSLQIEQRSTEEFWTMVREWQMKGWITALHGYDHVYLTKDAGILKIKSDSEFASLPLEAQEIKIKKGIDTFTKNGLKKPTIFVAPSHSLDKNTITALKNNGIMTVSDGLYTHMYSKYGITWIPCQLSHPKLKKEGLWTLCYHPEKCSESAFKALEDFIDNYKSQFIADLSLLEEEDIRLIDVIEDFKIKFLNTQFGKTISKCLLRLIK